MGNLAKLFINKPVATWLLSMALILAGYLGMQTLPVSPLPQMDFPTISVSASMPGASAETVASSLAAPLERVLGAIPGVTEMTSNSKTGTTRINIQFESSRNIDDVASDVQAALSSVRSSLPSAVSGMPSFRKSNPASFPILILALRSEKHGTDQMFRYANDELLPRISQIKGVGDVTIAGGSAPAIRVNYFAEKLLSLGIAPDALIKTIQSTQSNLPKGALNTNAGQWVLEDQQAYTQAEDFEPLIIRQTTTATGEVRVRDVAEVRTSTADDTSAGYAGQDRAVLLFITQASDANIIETIDTIKTALPLYGTILPSGMSLVPVMDRSPVIRAALEEIEKGIVISIALVVFVVFVYLKRFKATIIPALSLPVSMMGCFVFMHFWDGSINNLSLMAMIVATGFVIDDAIVVTEHISRHIQLGKTPLQAAHDGLDEIGFTIVSMSCSLVSVFLPFVFFDNLIGQFFKEFSLTVAAMIFLSMLVSLTLTPMLCARWLEPTTGQLPERAPIMDALEHAYSKVLNVTINHVGLTILSLVGVLALSVFFFGKLNKDLLPNQDTGRMMVMMRGDQSASFDSIHQKFKVVRDQLLQVPEIESVTGSVSDNSARMFISLRPLTQRHLSIDEVINKLRPSFSKIPGVSVNLVSLQDFRVGAREAGANNQYTLFGDDLHELNAWAKKLEEALKAENILQEVSSDNNERSREMKIQFDVPKMQQLGLGQTAVNTAFNNQFGERKITTINDQHLQTEMILGVASDRSNSVDALSRFKFLNPSGQVIPLSSFASWQLAQAANEVNHQTGNAAVTLSFNMPIGYALSEAEVHINEVATKIGLPANIFGAFQGTAKMFKEVQSQQALMLVVSILSMYLILGILYEHLIHPLTILSTIPAAILGALMALVMTQTPFTLMALIGILLLIGVVKKNAILMVDHALQLERDLGYLPAASIKIAALRRLRPILMTTMAAVFGAIPLVIGHADGFELRQPLGITVIGGLLAAQVLNLLSTPVVYIVLSKIKWPSKSKRRVQVDRFFESANKQG